MNSTELAFLHKRVAENFASQHPSFCGAKLIYSPYRRGSAAEIYASLELQRELMENLPGFVIGYDLVGQEDLGKPLIDFADLLLSHSFPYYFHAGETNWQGQSTDINLIDAILLGAKRIGMLIDQLQRSDMLAVIMPAWLKKTMMLCLFRPWLCHCQTSTT